MTLASNTVLPNGGPVDRQLEAYNRGDIDAFAACFTNDVIMGPLDTGPTEGTTDTRGLTAVRARYGDLFKRFPHNRARILNRMVLGSTVIDHEDIDRGPGAEKFQTLAIYTLAGDKIARVHFIRP